MTTKLNFFVKQSLENINMKLPVEIIIEIFNYLSIKDIVRLKNGIFNISLHFAVQSTIKKKERRAFDKWKRIRLSIKKNGPIIPEFKKTDSRTGAISLLLCAEGFNYMHELEERYPFVISETFQRILVEHGQKIMNFQPFTKNICNDNIYIPWYWYKLKDVGSFVTVTGGDIFDAIFIKGDKIRKICLYHGNTLFYTDSCFIRETMCFYLPFRIPLISIRNSQIMLRISAETVTDIHIRCGAPRQSMRRLFCTESTETRISENVYMKTTSEGWCTINK